MFDKTTKTSRKTTKCRVTGIDIPMFGKPRIYLFSQSIGIIILRKKELLKHISIDNEVDLLYHIVYEEDKTTFVRYEPVTVLYNGVRIEL